MNILDGEYDTTTLLLETSRNTVFQETEIRNLARCYFSFPVCTCACKHIYNVIILEVILILSGKKKVKNLA